MGPRLNCLACITEIVSRFDVVAIQEAQKDLRALRHMLKALGDRWTVILTDPTEDDSGDDERLAFVFDRDRLEVSGLACELVVPLNRRKKSIRKIALDLYLEVRLWDRRLNELASDSLYAEPEEAAE